MRKDLRIVILLLIIHASVAFVKSSDESGIDETGLEPAKFSRLIKKVADQLKIQHLGIVKKNKRQYNGIIWGTFSRALAALPVRMNKKQCKTKINIIFRVDPAAADTRLNRESLQALYRNCPSLWPRFQHSYYVRIAGQPLYAEQTQGVSILGSDFMTATNAFVTIKYYGIGEGFCKLELQKDMNNW